jgi:uncharacterized Fe-S cluster protein YjdI/CDGSH-type Zn-finger protein
MSKHREYPGDGFVVTYDAEICTHAAECVNGLPSVFEQNRRPWIDPSQDSAAAIRAVITLCPSGALAFVSSTDSQVDSNEPLPVEGQPEPGTTIKTLVDGPLRIEGTFALVNAQGEVISEKAKLSLCRCGASKNKPFCDGAHRDIGFSSEAPQT